MFTMIIYRRQSRGQDKVRRNSGVEAVAKFLIVTA
jgi:hypothetical protein